MGKKIGIDASRCRSGGGIAYLLGILTGADPTVYGIGEVHLWTYKSFINKIPHYPWLVKHCPDVLEKSMIHQLWWQYQILPKELQRLGCDLLFNPDAGTVCQFFPAVTISQDMLSYEPGEMKRFIFSKAWLRLLLLRYVQSRSLKNSIGAIFATNYVKEVIEKIIGEHKNARVIPHGIGENFRQSSAMGVLTTKEIKCLYVSNALLYKHQWHVVAAIGLLRKKGIKLSLLLVGGGEGRAQHLLEEQMSLIDPKGRFLEQKDFVPHHKIPEYLMTADVFIFASSCENMPITLLEGMASGLPIACSNRGPMPEVLEDGGVYFDPENPKSIADAIELIANDDILRKKIAKRAQLLSEQYSWQRCATETWDFISESI